MNGQNICKCDNKKCKKKNDCFRFNIAEGELMQFKNVCDKKNNYEWFMSISPNLVEKK